MNPWLLSCGWKTHWLTLPFCIFRNKRNKPLLNFIRSRLSSGFSTLIAGTIITVVGQVLLITALSFPSCKMSRHVEVWAGRGLQGCSADIAESPRSNYTKIILESLPQHGVWSYKQKVSTNIKVIYKQLVTDWSLIEPFWNCRCRSRLFWVAESKAIHDTSWEVVTWLWSC